jgi:hypothetical protein
MNTVEEYLALHKSEFDDENGEVRREQSKLDDVSVLLDEVDKFLNNESSDNDGSSSDQTIPVHEEEAGEGCDLEDMRKTFANNPGEEEELQRFMAMEHECSKDDAENQT